MDTSASMPVDSSPPLAEASPTDVPPDAGPSEAPEGDVRARLVAQFEQWLDRMLAGEPPPEGIAEEVLAEIESATGHSAPRGADADLYTLFSALTTLSGEIRLQGRAFKQLTDALAPLSALPRGIEQLYSLQQDSAERIDQLLAQTRPSEKESAESSLPPPKQVLAVLMDLYDRMNRGKRVLQSAADALVARAPRGVGRWFAGSTVSDARHSLASVLEGYGLTLTRLQDALDEWGVERIGRPGERFDPARMTAIEIGPADGAADGAVLDIYRTGYAVRGSVLATAQVKVARGNQAKEAENG
jgi:molecular chaperone GrpE